MFTFLLLVAAIVFFILWRDAKQQVIRAKNEEFDRGYSSGYWSLADRLKKLLFGDGVEFDINKLKQEIGVTEQAVGDERMAEASAGFSGPAISDERMTEALAQAAVETPAIFGPAVNSPEPTEPTESAPVDNSVRNLNILLFVSSMLFVAAGAAFVSAAMPAEIKLIGVWALVAAFYAVGLFLQDSEKLRPAGVAFAGTGLGLLPFAGLALHQLAHMPGEIAWLLTSLIGVVAYFYAAITMRSQVVGYLTLAFALSFSASLGSSIALPMVWSFVAIIGVGLAINLFAYAWPDVVPEVFRKPVEVSGQIVVPLTIFLSLFFTRQMSIGSYELITGVSMAYYVVAWLQTNAVMYRHIVRALAQIFILLVVSDIFDTSGLAFGVALAATAMVQQLISLILRDKESPQESWVWIGIMQFAMFLAPMFWLSATYAEELLTLDYVLLGMFSLAAMLRFRMVAAAIPGVIMSILLPFIVGRMLINPPLSWDMLAVWFVFSAGLLALGRLATRAKFAGQAALLLDASFITYLIIAAFLTASASTAIAAIVLAVGAALLWANSYIATRPTMAILGSIGFVLSVARLVADSSVDANWRALSVLAIVGPVLYAAAWYMISRKDTVRTMGLLGLFWAVSMITIMISFFDTETQMAAALSLILIAGTVAIEGQRQNLQSVLELAAYMATFGLQRVVGIGSDGEVNTLFYAHWWALTIFAIGRWQKAGETRTIIALGIVTFMSAIYALGEGGGYQLLFLVEHILVLIAGALMDRQWAIRWGLIASVLAVLWFLKDIAYVALAFLGLVVIGIVIWRLKTTGSRE